MADLIEIRGIPNEGPRRGLLNALFGAQYTVEVWQRRRRAAGRAIIVLSLPMAYFLLTDKAMVAAGGLAVLSAWAVAFIAGCVAAAGLAHAERDLERLLSRAGGQTADTNANEPDDAA